ncbi:MAG TPA: LapA family protein [Casimicrobiaceae bacterium]|nr:LapA family protein [Casimicrobiaceae bacterium]
MSIRTVGLVLLVAILAVFVVVNWTAFTTPTSLSLLVGTVDAPLGLLMLMVTALLGVVFLAYIVWLQTSVLLESRRLNRELAAQRQLADQAESSRFTELRTHIDQSINGLAAQIGELDDRLAGRGGPRP